MNRSFLFVFAWLFCFAKSDAQKDTLSLRPDRLLFSFSAGAAFPAFTQKDPYPPMLGRIYRTDLTFHFLNWLGLNCSYSQTINQTQDPSGPVTNINYYGGMGNPYKYNTYVYWSGPWQTRNFCLGLILQTKTNPVRLQFKVAGGFQNVTTPPIHLYYPGSNYSYEYGEDHKQTFVFNMGISFQRRLIRGLFLGGGLDFYDSVIDGSSVSDPQKNILIWAYSIGVTYSIW